jgi:pilus assembly protein Flp/PilA
MRALFRKLIEDESGQDMAEYGILLALIAVLLVAAVTGLKANIKIAFDAAASALLPGS